ncbi:MAG: D-alanyl-D-alanine carboxypeptidase family protein [Candidatus Paceibacterota bacterium]
MKKFTLPLVICLTAIFVLSFLILPNVNKFITSQMAAVVGININKVMQWSSQRGLNKDLAIGDSGKDVYLLQYALSKTSNNFLSSNITGYFGKKTLQTVSDFQKLNNLNVSGRLDSTTRSVLNSIYFKELCPDGQNNIFPDDIAIYVNKNNSLPIGYIPNNLIDISDVIKTFGIICVKQEAAPFLKKMFDDAFDKNITLAVTSGFRRPEVQSILYKALLLVKGEKAKNRVAEPSHSEHQLGTTIDLTGGSINYLSASNKFEGTVEDLWLRQNAYKYGFVLSYPKDKTLVTGYDHEPWHYRFVGIDIAKEIFDKQISAEEYFNSI